MSGKVIKIEKLGKIRKEFGVFDEHGISKSEYREVDNLFLVTYENGDSIALTKEQIEEQKLSAEVPQKSKQKSEKVANPA